MSSQVSRTAKQRAEVERLQAENARVRREIEELLEASVITRADYDTRFRLVAHGSNRLPVGDLCRLLGVARSGYYAWQARCGQCHRRSKVPNQP